jgi:hypothetical protein
MKTESFQLQPIPVFPKGFGKGKQKNGKGETK